MDIGHWAAIIAALIPTIGMLLAKRAEARALLRAKTLEGALQGRDLAHREAEGIWEDASEWRQEQGKRIEQQGQVIADQGRTIAALQARVLALEARDGEREIEIERLRAQGCSLAPDCAQREPANGKGGRKRGMPVVGPASA